MRGICLGFLLALVIMGIMGMAGGAYAACHTGDYYINQSMTLDGSFCNINDSNYDGAIVINSDDILLDCNGSIFNNSGYYGNSVGLVASGFQNITILNCSFQNYLNGIWFIAVQDSSINFSNTSNNWNAGIVLGNSTNIALEGNIFENNDVGVASYMNRGNFIFNNNLINNNNTFGMSFYSNMISNDVKSGNTITNSYEFDIYNINSTGIDFGSGITYDSLRQDWSIKFNITNKSGDTIFGYTVIGADKNGNSNPIAMPHGYPPAFGFTVEYVENSSGIFNYTPHTINVTKTGYYPNSTIIDLTRSMTIHLTLNQTFVPPVDTGAPSIDSHVISPQTVANGSSVILYADVTDNVGVDSIWAEVDYPGAGADTVTLTNKVNYYYNVTLLGRHSITIFANDTSGNTTNVTGFFDSMGAISIDINISENDGGGVDSDVVVYQNGTTVQVASYSDSSGDFQNKILPNGTYDIQFTAFSDDLVVLLENIDIWTNANKFFSMDDPPAVTGFELTYAAETDYIFSGAVIRIYYSSSDVGDEDNIKLFRCDDWNFTTRYCNSTWNDTGATLNKSDNYFELSVSGFSAFSILQESFCGDGVCGINENSTNCSSDCVCNTGDTRLCSLNYDGECGVGIQTCSGAVWSACPTPKVETCNNKDDDCDGVKDDISGGNSVISTLCGCYNGTLPSPEISDGIDNNCNGFIDEGCECNNTETDVCGSNVGACSQGTKTCTNCKWGTCVGGLGPYGEVCGNGIDDDCDGETDELSDCVIENNNTCSYGAIPSTGCKCGVGTYSSGHCCNGVYKNEPCPEFPWWILIVIGGVALAAILVYYILHEKTKGTGKDEWAALEKKYTPAKM